MKTAKIGLLPLLLLAALWGGCRPKEERPRVSMTFYSVHRDGDKLLVDTTVVLRIVDGQTVVDDRDKNRTRVFRIDHFGLQKTQIFLEYDRESRYSAYRRGKPRWERILGVFDGYLMLNRHADLPMYYYEYPHSSERYLVIDSTEVVSSGFGFYRFPDQEWGQNDPTYYNEYDVWADGGRKKQEVIFRMADTASYRKLTTARIFDAIGYRVTGDDSSKLHIRMPIPAEHRDFDLFVTFTESDHGPCDLLTVTRSGKLADYLFIPRFQDFSFMDDDERWVVHRQEGDFEVYADYSVLETIRTDSLGVSWIETNAYSLDRNGEYQKTSDGRTMRAMNWPNRTELPQVQAVHDFLTWYGSHHEAIDTLSLLDRSADRYTVDRQACRAFVDRLVESGLVSFDYLSAWEAYFDKYERYYREEPVDDGDPPGFEHDLILRTQEPEIALAAIPQDLIVTRIIRRGEDRAEVTVDLWASRITYTLTRQENRWLIDGQQ